MHGIGQSLDVAGLQLSPSRRRFGGLHEGVQETQEDKPSGIKAEDKEEVQNQTTYHVAASLAVMALLKAIVLAAVALVLVARTKVRGDRTLDSFRHCKRFG